ncbi:MAG: hypothetical protein RLZZ520_287 [Bacteroidota bacterium]|jgi:hypothetical protein
MKKIVLSAVLLAAGIVAFAQPKIVERAIVKAKTEITFPENFSFGGPGGPGGGGDGPPGGFTMPRDMETTTTMTYSPDYMKIESLSDFGNNVVITDRKKKVTTTLIEAMGRKTGWFTSDAEAEAQARKQDSTRKARRDSLAELGLTFTDNKPELIYSDETKKVSGYTCKKVTIKTKGQNGQVTENVIWYNPDFKLAASSTAASANGGGFGGGGRGRMSMMSGVPGLDQIEGFPMEYESTAPSGFKIHMVVLKFQADPAIDEKTFEVPKGFDVKPQSTFEGQGGMRMIFRSGGN